MPEETLGVLEPQETVEKVSTAYEPLITTPEEYVEPEYKPYEEAVVGERVEAATEYRAPETFVPPSATVAGQLETLLAKDSKYIEQARIGAAERAQERGLLSTSLAAGAGEQAAIQEALKIATPDAAAYARAAGVQQQYEYEQEKAKGMSILSNELMKQEAAIQMKNQDIQNTFSVAREQAGTEAQIWMKDLEVNYGKNMLELESIQTQLINQQQFDAARAESIRSQTGSVMQNYQISVENLMTDPDFLQLGSEAVNKAINEMQTLAKNSINFIGSSNGVDLTPFVDEYLADITVMEPTPEIVEEPVV